MPEGVAKKFGSLIHAYVLMTSLGHVLVMPQVDYGVEIVVCDPM